MTGARHTGPQSTVYKINILEDYKPLCLVKFKTLIMCPDTEFNTAENTVSGCIGFVSTSTTFVYMIFKWAFRSNIGSTVLNCVWTIFSATLQDPYDKGQTIADVRKLMRDFRWIATITIQLLLYLFCPNVNYKSNTKYTLTKIRPLIFANKTV